MDNTWIAIEHPSQAFYLPIHAGNVLQKFGFEIQNQSEVRVRKPKNLIWPPGGHFESDISENQYSRSRLKFFPYTLVMCNLSLDLIFKAKQKVESGNRKIQDGRQAAILKMTSLKINRLRPILSSTHPGTAVCGARAWRWKKWLGPICSLQNCIVLLGDSRKVTCRITSEFFDNEKDTFIYIMLTVSWICTTKLKIHAIEFCDFIKEFVV